MTTSTFLRRVTRQFFLLVASAFALSAWSATLEVTDALGRKVKVNSPVQRVALNFNFEEFTAVPAKKTGPRWWVFHVHRGRAGAR
jgi:ABC-type Fe3+-hydroxamate transport system substrate-binding protein